MSAFSTVLWRYSDFRGNNKWEAGEIMSGGEEVTGAA